MDEKECHKCRKILPVEKFKYGFGFNDYMFENNPYSTRCESCRGKAARREADRRRNKKTPTSTRGPKMSMFKKPVIKNWVGEREKQLNNDLFSTGYNMRSPGPPRTTDYGDLLVNELSAMANPELPGSKRLEVPSPLMRSGDPGFVTTPTITISNPPIHSSTREPTEPPSPQVASSANEQDFDEDLFNEWWNSKGMELNKGGKKRKSKKRKKRKTKKRKTKKRKSKKRKIFNNRIY